MNQYSPAEDRFWARVAKTDDCWQWLGSLSMGGYGSIRDEGRAIPVHRFSYQLHKGDIPYGMVLDHLCRNRGCVNPDHLEIVSIKTNVLRGVGITAQLAKQNECKNGHEYNDQNTYYYRGNKRICRLCRKVTMKNYKLRLKDGSGVTTDPLSKVRSK